MIWEGDYFLVHFEGTWISQPKNGKSTFPWGQL